MKPNMSKLSWLNPTNEIDFPLHKALLSSIMTLVISLAVAVILMVLVNLSVELYLILVNGIYFYALVIVELVVCLSVLMFIVRILALTRIRQKHNEPVENIKIGFRKPSYVQFVWVGIMLSPLLIILLQHLNVPSEPWLSLAHRLDDTLLLVLAFALLILFTFGGYRHLVDEHLRFAPGTTNKDEFGYMKAAIKDMQRIIGSKEHIFITNINGRLGEGKSSYLRMMIESQNQSDFLYTFISLTETNETKSFSKLFAERWSDTISSRYPSIISSAKNSVIDNIFRESVSGFLKAIYSMLNVARWPIYRTRIKESGDNYPNIKHASPTIASLFAFVPHFNEKYWVIVIDEIERARFDEIYRTVETIERFKIEAQWGLPIKLIFILCTDRMKFRGRVADDGLSNEAAKLAYSFFEKEPKTIDMHIDLPPVSPDKKQAFIIKREKEWLIEPYEINVDAISNPDTNKPADLNLYWLSDMIDASDFERGRLDDKKAHDLMLQYLLGESPRFIKKVLEETQRFLDIFTKSERSPDQIRLSDLIMLHYLKFKYPEVLRFLYDIHPEVFPDFYHGSEIGSAYSLMKYFTRKRSDKDMNLQKYYEQRMGHSLEDSAVVERIIGYICYPVIEHIANMGLEDSNASYEDAGNPNYDRTLGLPENMWDALTIATEKVQDTSIYLRTQRDEIYTHEHQKLPIHLMRNGTKLLNFSRNMRRFYPGDNIVSRLLAIRIARVISTKRLVPRYPGSLTSETPYQNLLYQFSFHLANYIGGDDTDPVYIEEGFNLLKQILESDETMLEGKLVIINSLFIYSQQSRNGSFDLNRARIALESKYSVEIKKLITQVMNKGLDKYLPRSKRSIYDYEENYMYAMYQMWSGDPNDMKSINKIREVAAYGLAEHPKVIGHYWQNRFSNNGMAVENPELQVEIETLIKATKKAKLEKEYGDYIERWTKELNKKKVPISAVDVNNDFSTARLQLSKLGYIIT